MAVIVVRGTGDVASAVAHVLYRAGHRVVLHDTPVPSHSRRAMAFVDALYEGKAELAGVLAKRARDVSALPEMLRCRRAVPVVDEPLQQVLAEVHPQVLVDARMRKHDQAEAQRRLAPLTIGLGPNFQAGSTTDVAVETAWGDELGRVVRAGRTRDLEGEPQQIEGHARDRYVYAPCAGVFSTALNIGDNVTAGQEVACIGDVPLSAPLSGRLRGLSHHGAPVAAGAKVIEVDPRGDSGRIAGLGERPSRIAAGVLQAIQEARLATPDVEDV
jgi:xanthine dehydrogenase accessory factor